MELWFTEKQNDNVQISYKINKINHTEKTPYQEMAVIETEQYGRMLVLDHFVMLEDTNEFIYHEMISHVPLFTHPNPVKVAVIGGGDGGVIREVIKHPSVKKAVLIEIDKRVVEISKEYFPKVSSALNNERVDVLYEDGIKYMQEHKNEFDVVLVDSTDPVGPAVGLFAIDFYKSIYEALKVDGILVSQTESPFDNAELLKKVNQSFKSLFPITKVYTAFIPTYPTGMWTFTMGSKKYDPAQVNVSEIKWSDYETNYINQEIFKSCFALPNFLKRLLGQ